MQARTHVWMILTIPCCSVKMTYNSQSENQVGAECRSPDGVAPAILVTAQVALHGPADAGPALLRELLAALLPWAMTHHHSTRTFALLVLRVRLVRRRL